ncbi:uncharacterized protein LOC122638642 [Telopea speciosissima]|uniref:uncharacterized protein LOC122638642 n=1 Tax=Telopea speciosissima TaxID=54955 RepID=UPI001CC34C03|nr:uncharacterized protein LOC122638642 [Telopea speciosissima]
MAPHPNLLGPPKIHLSTPSSTGKTDPSKPSMGFTENNSLTFLSSGNPCLDFFFHVVPNTPPESLKSRLDLAWNYNASTTLKLICNLRGVRGTGKSDKEGFYTAALWLHKYHPKTLACNVRWFADFGYFKDLPEILYRLIQGDDVRRIAKQGRPNIVPWKSLRSLPPQMRRRCQRQRQRQRRRPIPPMRMPPFAPMPPFTPMSMSMSMSMPLPPSSPIRMPMFKRKMSMTETQQPREKRITRSLLPPREERIAAAIENDKINKEKARDMRNEKIVSMAKKAVERYSRDPDYRFLHDRISDVFAELLVADLEFLKSGQLKNISLAAKWCPSLDSSFDRSILLCESIARRVFPRDSYPEYEGIEDAHYAYRIRDRLRKEYLVPIRESLELPEVYMSANLWNSLPYNRVSSVAMKTNKEHFLKHDKERFNEYLVSVEHREDKIAAGALLPHDIIKSIYDEDDGGKVAEFQWRRMVEDVSKKGKLRNCIAVCDVSGSMNGTPMEVCVALGLLMSELSEEPWKGKVITFSQSPQLHMIKGDDLKSKTEFIRHMDWGTNTDFQKVFDQILKVALESKIKEEEMIKRVFVFSDMEFDQASGNKWETDYEVIQRKFKESGYASVPEIVFWNLRDSQATPVASNQSGVALVSGFSKNMVNLFLDRDGVVSPNVAMECAISGEEYQKLVVLD